MLWTDLLPFIMSLNTVYTAIGTIRKHLKKTHTDTQTKFYKVVARPSLLYGSETWVTMKRDMTGLEAAEMRFLRSVTGYTRLDKIRTCCILRCLMHIVVVVWCNVVVVCIVVSSFVYCSCLVYIVVVVLCALL